MASALERDYEYLVSAVWWDELEAPWRACLELAWESFCKGSIPVGAVVIGPDGSIVASGRNRQRESVAPPPQVAGTSLAHAEINALVQLSRGDYASHTLYSTLQPCLLCTGAICHSHVGTVRYAAGDPLVAGIDRLPELNAHIGSRWPVWDGPYDSPFASWAQVLTFVFAARRDAAILKGMTRSPDLHARAQAVMDLSASLDALTDAPLDDVLRHDGVTEMHDMWAALIHDR